MDFSGEGGTTTGNLARALTVYSQDAPVVVRLVEDGRERVCRVQLRYSLGRGVLLFILREEDYDPE